MHTTPTEVSHRLIEAREAAGMTQADIAYGSRQFHPRFRISQSKVARIEAGGTVDPLDLLVIATVLEIQVSDLDPTALDALTDLRTLLTRTPGCITAVPLAADVLV